MSFIGYTVQIGFCVTDIGNGKKPLFGCTARVLNVS